MWSKRRRENKGTERGKPMWGEGNAKLKRVRKVRSWDWDKRRREQTERNYPSSLLFRNGNGVYRGDRIPSRCWTHHSGSSPSAQDEGQPHLFSAETRGSFMWRKGELRGEQGGWRMTQPEMGNMKVDSILCVLTRAHIDRGEYIWLSNRCFS